ncbi:MAG: NYN domain-containing protein, partial [Terriglobales bacterium]
MNEEKLKIAVFIDFDNIQIGVRSTLNRDFDLALVLEALKERGEVVTKIAYGNWKRAGELTRTLTQNAVLMVQRDLTPRGDKNGADINLALDALEMAINHSHINAFVIVGGDSDFIALVEKLKQYNKAVFVVGGRSFTSSVLQRNCREFLAYENLVEATSPSERRRDDGVRRRAVYALERAVPLVYRGLKVLADREVQPQLGLLKSTLIQLDSTFNERDYGASSFRAFMEKMAAGGLLNLRQQGNSFVVEPLEREPQAASELVGEGETHPESAEDDGGEGSEPGGTPGEYSSSEAAAVAPTRPPEEALDLLQRILAPLQGTNPRPLYLRNVKQLLRTEEPNFDEQQFGFGSIVDLLRAGQNQNWLRLQRDRRGALRVFIPPTGNAAGSPGSLAASAASDGEAAGDGTQDNGNRTEPDSGAPAADDDRQPGFDSEQAA